MIFPNKPYQESGIKVWLLKQFSRFMRKFFSVDIGPPPGISEMITSEQRMNIKLLIQQIADFHIQGDFAELGCFTGQSAMHIQTVLLETGINREFHVYDKFELKVDGIPDIKEALVNNFEKANLGLPVIHTGDVEETLPAELPQQLAFVHLDLTIGLKQQGLKKLLMHSLESIYPRLSKGGICIIMDYHDPKTTKGGLNQFPELKQACDEFFFNRPEKVYPLYGGRYSHGYFRKT